MAGTRRLAERARDAARAVIDTWTGRTPLLDMSPVPGSVDALRTLADALRLRWELTPSASKGAATILAMEPTLRVTSGRRTAQHNRAVGGVPDSFHLTGRAVDFIGSGVAMRRASELALAVGAVEVLIHDSGSGKHLHLAW